jgi:hypothetical protein
MESFRDEVDEMRMRPVAEPASVMLRGDEATIITEASPDLGDIDQLLRDRNLDPEEWIVMSCTVNEWDAMAGKDEGGENRIIRMRQLKVALKRKLTLLLLSPVVDVPRIPRVGKLTKGDPDLIVVEGDHQAPYHSLALHSASLALLQRIQPQEHILLGDLGDYPTISRFRDHPAAMASVNAVNQASYEILRDKREASPDSTCKLLQGNHGYRIEAELLQRAERMYDIRPAETEGGPELSALSLRRLLHLDALGVELVEDHRGWDHAEIEIVPGQRGLVARHGWLTGQNTARRSMDKRGRSIICGHTHQPELTFKWDASSDCWRQAAVVGCMCLVRNERYPHFAVCDNWLQGLAVVSRWDNGDFLIEHVPWSDGTLTWRGERFTS